jgi:hypothetical protein
VKVLRENLTEMGREALLRAQLELERRYVDAPSCCAFAVCGGSPHALVLRSAGFLFKLFAACRLCLQNLEISSRPLTGTAAARPKKIAPRWKAQRPS